ncbi:MAG: hypothetical protein ACC726_12880 [Chloroflexota bacterium]
MSAPAPFDSFKAAVPDAGTIVVGTVEPLAEGERVAIFRLQVDEILRGDAPAAMRFIGLSGGKGRSACGDMNAVWARDGDRLALAMGAAVPGQRLRVRAVAFVGSSKPDRQSMPKIEQLSLRQVRRLAGKALDGSTSRRPYDAGRAADNLITERVAPGIARVSELGTNQDFERVRSLDVSPEGRVWAATRDSTFQLGRRAEFGIFDGLPERVGSITASPRSPELPDHEDGQAHKARALVDGSGVSILQRNHGWKRALGGNSSKGFTWLLMAMDGTIWVRSESNVIRLDGTGKLRFGWDVIGPPIGCMTQSNDDPKLDCTTTRMVEVPDGGVWLGFASSTPESPLAGGLRLFDGEVWAEAPDPLGGEPFAVTQLTAYQGGDVWVLIVPEDAEDPGQGAYDRAELARWDGETWARYELPPDLQEEDGGDPRELVAGPDGTVWLSRPLASFDGETWRDYDTPARAASKRPRVQDLSIAPDGSAWMVVRDANRPGRTRPDGIYILDPARAKPTKETMAAGVAMDAVHRGG